MSIMDMFPDMNPIHVDWLSVPMEVTSVSWRGHWLQLMRPPVVFHGTWT